MFPRPATSQGGPRDIVRSLSAFMGQASQYHGTTRIVAYRDVQNGGRTHRVGRLVGRLLTPRRAWQTMQSASGP